MNLETLGLTLLKEIIDEPSHTHCFVCNNIAGKPLFEGDESDSIVVLFRGTVTKENLKTDFRTDQVRLGPWETASGANSGYGSVEEGSKTSWGPFIHAKDEGDLFSEEQVDGPFNSIRIHKGFWDSYGKVRTRLMKVILEEVGRVMRAGKGLPPKVYVTGHSLGGALAQLCSFDIACNITVDVDVVKAEKSSGIVGLGKRALKRGRRNSLGGGGRGGERVKSQLGIACYTYGSPRVGNGAWSVAAAYKVPHLFRVFVEGDLFVGLPKWSLGSWGIYRHAGTECILDENETGNIVIAPTFAEKAFRFSRRNTSVANHNLVKYRSCLEKAFGEEELGEYYGGISDGGKGGGGTTTIVPSWLLR